MDRMGPGQPDDNWVAPGLDYQKRIAELEAQLAEFNCDGRCDPESCRSCRADLADELQAQLASLQGAVDGLLASTKERGGTLAVVGSAELLSLATIRKAQEVGDA